MKSVNAGDGGNPSSTIIDVIDLTKDDDDHMPCILSPSEEVIVLTPNPSKNQSGWTQVTTALPKSSPQNLFYNSTTSTRASPPSALRNVGKNIPYCHLVKKRIFKWQRRRFFRQASPPIQNGKKNQILKLLDQPYIPIPEKLLVKSPATKKKRKRKRLRQKQKSMLLLEENSLDSENRTGPSFTMMSQVNQTCPSMLLPPVNLTGPSIWPGPHSLSQGYHSPSGMPLLSMPIPTSLLPQATMATSSTMPSNNADFIPLQKLRPIVIDGMDVATTHAHPDKAFSSKGLDICVKFFRQRGHEDIVVFLPHTIKRSRFPLPLRDEQVLQQLEKDNLVKYAPSRIVDNTLIQCSDDSFILELASLNGGIVVSNRSFHRAAKDKPHLQEIATKQQLVYCLVQDHFMPAFDPMGRFGPKLNEFLAFPPNSIPTSL